MKITGPLKFIYFNLVVAFLFISPFALKAQQNDIDKKALYTKLKGFYDDYNNEAILEHIKNYNPSIFKGEDTLTYHLNVYAGESYFAVEGKANIALQHLEKAKEIADKIQKKDESYSTLLNNLVFIYREAGKYEKAYIIYPTLLEMDEAAFGKHNPVFFQTQKDYGVLLRLVNKHAEAEKLFIMILSTLSEKDLNYPGILQELGQVYIEAGKYSKAQKVLERAIMLTKEHQEENSPAYFKSSYAKAQLHLQRGEFDFAENIYSNLLSMNKKDPSLVNKQNEALIYNELGLICRKTGRYDEAEDYFNLILNFQKETLSTNHPSYGTTLSNIGLARQFAGKIEDAKQNYLESKEILEINSKQNSIQYTSVLNSLGVLERNERKLEPSLDYFKKSKEILENMGLQKTAYYPLTLKHIALSYYVQNNHKEAEKYYNEALKVKKQNLGVLHPEYAITTNQFARLQWKLNKHKKAEQYYKETFNNYFHQIEAFFPTMSEQEKSQFYNNKLRLTFEEFNAYAIDQYKKNPALLGDIYDYQLSTKALIMYATGKVRSSIYGSGDQALIQKYEQWISMKEQIAKLYSQPKAEGEKGSLLDSLIIASNKAEKELSRLSAAFSDVHDQKQITWKDVQKKLKNNEAAIEMIRYREFSPDSGGYFTDKVVYAALIVTPKTKKHPELVLINNGEMLEGRIRRNYRNSIRYRNDESISYNAYWKHIQEKLKDVQTVYFSPDGVYNQLSLLTLKNPDTQKFLIDELDIRRVTNTKDILAYKDSKTDFSSSQAYLFGYPNYFKGIEEDKALAIQLAQDISNTVRLDRGLRGSLERHLRSNALLELLPGTKVEVETIADLYQDKTIAYNMYLENDAIEETVKSVKNPTTLHIATHGFFMDDADEPQINKEDHFVQNPLLRSGLIMAGVNSYLTSEDAENHENDGILTAYEAMNLNLNNTELVVLSACETGLGSVKNGEGVYGLQRAFQIAGAKAVIMSLWNVDDEATQELMTTFYKEWLISGDKKAAFKAAQLALKEKYTYPFYWGAFILIGD
jgi:CHAT domain-containing protein